MGGTSSANGGTGVAGSAQPGAGGSTSSTNGGAVSNAGHNSAGLPGSAEESSGCSCRVAGAPRSTTANFAALAGLALGVVSTARRRRTRGN